MSLFSHFLSCCCQSSIFLIKSSCRLSNSFRFSSSSSKCFMSSCSRLSRSCSQALRRETLNVTYSRPTRWTAAGRLGEAAFPVFSSWASWLGETLEQIRRVLEGFKRRARAASQRPLFFYSRAFLVRYSLDLSLSGPSNSKGIGYGNGLPSPKMAFQTLYSTSQDR